EVKSCCACWVGNSNIEMPHNFLCGFTHSHFSSGRFGLVLNLNNERISESCLFKSVYLRADIDNRDGAVKWVRTDGSSRRQKDVRSHPRNDAWGRLRR